MLTTVSLFETFSILDDFPRSYRDDSYSQWIGKTKWQHDWYRQHEDTTMTNIDSFALQ